MQQAFRDLTDDGASISFVIQDLPEDAPHDIGALLNYRMPDTLAFMRHRLREAKNTSSDLMVLPSHPFMCLCDACGIEYSMPEKTKVSRDSGEEMNSIACVVNKSEEEMAGSRKA